MKLVLPCSADQRKHLPSASECRRGTARHPHPQWGPSITWQLGTLLRRWMRCLDSSLNLIKRRAHLERLFCKPAGEQSTLLALPHPASCGLKEILLSLSIHKGLLPGTPQIPKSTDAQVRCIKLLSTDGPPYLRIQPPAESADTGGSNVPVLAAECLADRRHVIGTAVYPQFYPAY